jgi:hypothetical protein
VSLDHLDLYRLVRARLEHEDILTVNRLSWLVASQSFLFTAYAITLNGLAVAGHSSVSDRQAMLCRVIPLVGLATTALIYAGLLAGAVAMKRLRAELRQRVGEEERLGVPAVLPSESIMTYGQIAPRMLPIVFLVVWMYLLIVGGRG